MTDKELIRERILRHRESLNPTIVETLSVIICQKIQSLIETEDFKHIHCYLPMRQEIDTKPLIQWMLDTRRTVIVPKPLKNRQMSRLRLTSLDDLVQGVFKTWQPAIEIEYIGPIDAIIVPGIAFSRSGYRVGYGGGYYDTLLRETHALSIAPVYDFQLLDEIPVEPHDEKVDLIMTA